MLVRSGPQGRLQPNWTYVLTLRFHQENIRAAKGRFKVPSSLLPEIEVISSTAFTQCKGSAEPYRSPFIPSDGYSSPVDSTGGGRVPFLSDHISNLWQFSITPPNTQPEKQERFSELFSETPPHAHISPSWVNIHRRSTPTGSIQTLTPPSMRSLQKAGKQHPTLTKRDLARFLLC